MKYGLKKFMTFIIAISMVLSMHVSFADQGGGNLDLDEPFELIAKFEWKGNQWKPEGDANGVTVTGSAISVSFESDGPIYAIVIKGSTDNHVLYFDGVYSGSFDNEDLDNPGGDPDLSNIKFYTMLEPDDWMGDIRVVKTVDDPRDESPDLSGFEFTLYQVIDDEEVLVGSFTTGASGEVEFEDLEEGHYVLYETDRTWFYEGIDSDGLPIHLDEDSAPNGYIQVDVENERYYPEDWMGDIRVVKTVDDPRDESPDLSGFEFTLYQVIDDEEVLVGSFTTGASGEVEFEDLEEGHYVLYETDRTWFYEGIDSDGLPIHLDEDSAPNGYIQVDVENERYYPEEWMGEIRVVKTVDDPRDSTPSLSGFTFELFMVDDEEETFVRRITTNGTGVIVFEDLEEGQYKLYEQNEPGYDEGISASGRLINLNPDSEPNGRITIDVENERVYPQPDNDDDDEDEEEEEEEEEEEDDDDRPRPRPEPEEDEDEVEVLEVTEIEEEPTPEATPTPEPEPVIEVVEEPVPLATLPKTGAYDPSFFGGIGAALLGLGLFLKKKEDK